MKAGEADVGMKRRGSQLRKQNMVRLIFFLYPCSRALKRGSSEWVGWRKRDVLVCKERTYCIVRAIRRFEGRGMPLVYWYNVVPVLCLFQILGFFFFFSFLFLFLF